MKKITKLFLFFNLLNFVLVSSQSFIAGGVKYSIIAGTTNVSIAVQPNNYSGPANIPVSVTNGGTTYSVTTMEQQAFFNCYLLTTVSLPNSLTSIPAYAFGNSGLTAITIPNSVTSFGDGAFMQCSGLSTLIIPSSVTSIPASAFDSSGLTAITIPNSVTSIGSSAFFGCVGLTTFSIPSSVTSIGDFAFSICQGLTSMIIPNTVTSIGDYLFKGCNHLTSVTIPSSITAIKYGMFEDCSALTSFVIPNGITAIYREAFRYCTSLTSVSIPSSVTLIDDLAFVVCTSLTSLTCAIAAPLVISPNVFQSVNQSACTLTVQTGSLSAYQAAAVWQNFSPIIGSNLLSSDTFSISKTTSIYPNPNNGKFSINSNNEKVTQVSLFSLDGKLINTQKPNTLNPEIALPEISKGMYLVNIILESGSVSKSKIIIE